MNLSEIGRVYKLNSENKFVIDKNSTINFETISIKDKDNIFQVIGISLDKN